MRVAACRAAPRPYAVAMAAALHVDVVSDVVCPWCYIGKKRLEGALARRGGAAEVRWHPFQLNPDLPRAGADRRQYLEAKFGGKEAAAEIYARVEAAGRDAGIFFEFERIARQPNTLDAHRLIAWAQARHPTLASDLVERLFRAYFTQGVDLGNRDELARLAGEAGCDAFAAKALLMSDDGRADVAAADRHARSLGVTGVPLFIFNQRTAVSGAQAPETLLAAIRQSEAPA
jgi:predicted DsbA family dithiol-disulfide isomerase